jgi:hypothetical protein
MDLLTRLRRLLNPAEAEIELTLTDTGVTLSSSEGNPGIQWSDLQAVSICAMNHSSLMPFVFWRLRGSAHDLDFPDRATGADKVLKIVHNLDGFDSFLCAHAREGRHSGSVVVWRKPKN